LEVTDVRVRTSVPGNPRDVRNVTLLTAASDGPDRPDQPGALSGEPLHCVRETYERRLDEDLHEAWVTIALPRVFRPGEAFIIELAYEGALIDYGRDGRTYALKDPLNWMPSLADTRGLPGSRTSLTYRVPERFRVASGSTLVEERVVDRTRIMRWVSDEPVRSMSFNLGRFNVTEVESGGPPRVTVYGDRTHRGFAPGSLAKTTSDLITALHTYTDYFGPYPFDSLLVTETSTYNGLAFPGLVLLSFQAFGELHTGEAELFRAHEVAHQWWGIGVDFKDYRDQWLSEGFAHYSAAIYALSGLKKEDQFLEMLDAWRLDVLGEVNFGQGLGKHYGFRPDAIRRSDGHESGPLAVGYRLRTAETPFDYRILVYEKGAFVLHMLRMMLTDLETGDDTRFRDLMRGFATDHRSEAASTDAFEAAVTVALGEPMDWFFDQWVYGVDVPTYRPDLNVSRLIDQDDPFVLHGTIRQEDVPDRFRMSVPILIRFDDRQPIAHRVWVDADTVEVEIPLPAEPSKIEFNYLHGVLATVR
jgi:aminopeptidase N